MSGLTTWAEVQKEIQSLTFPEDNSNTIIFGAGFLGQLEAPLLKEDIQVIAFCDNDRRKQGKSFVGLPCISPAEIVDYQSPFVLVASIKHYSAISGQLSPACQCCTLDAYVIWRYFDSFSNVYDWLDEISRDIYAKLLLCRIRGDSRPIFEFCTDAQYFALPQFRFCGVNEIFVDCGAFVGENTQTFLANVDGDFQKIYLFEPSATALAAAKRRFEFLQSMWLFRDNQVVYEKKLIGKDHGQRIPFAVNAMHPGNSAPLENQGSTEMIEIVSLDRYFQERGETFTFLKADIEGAEWDMLLGAKEMIRTSKPKLAISIYHNIYDFFRIPKLLKELVPEYKLSVRHHWSDFNETILYCYV